jgi:hypothetical protein
MQRINSVLIQAVVCGFGGADKKGGADAAGARVMPVRLEVSVWVGWRELWRGVAEEEHGVASAVCLS